MKKMKNIRKSLDIIAGTIIIFCSIYFVDKELSINVILEDLKKPRFYFLILSSFFVSILIRYIVLKSIKKR
ncbi:hypothetical protein KUL118_41770 [Tenacibaculum sp. KUL118]|nr:hypothetical protein KUL118_41770 [Tenacibaculum sp. KUL118]